MEPLSNSNQKGICAYHLDRTAYQVCDNCGNFICNECERIHFDKLICYKCELKQKGIDKIPPWEFREKNKWFKPFIRTVYLSIFKPRLFFSSLKDEGKFGQIILYIFLVSLFVGLSIGPIEGIGLGGLIWSESSSHSNPSMEGDNTVVMIISVTSMLLFSSIFYPIIMAINAISTTFFWGLIYYLGIYWVDKSKASIKSTLRFYSYYFSGVSIVSIFLSFPIIIISFFTGITFYKFGNNNTLIILGIIGLIIYIFVIYYTIISSLTYCKKSLGMSSKKSWFVTFFPVIIGMILMLMIFIPLFSLFYAFIQL